VFCLYTPALVFFGVQNPKKKEEAKAKAEKKCAVQLVTSYSHDAI
jgi:hypothetical protein